LLVSEAWRTASDDVPAIRVGDITNTRRKGEAPDGLQTSTSLHKNWRPPFDGWSPWFLIEFYEYNNIIIYCALQQTT
jgi:hypothetical protein